ncbi:hypothetical protein QQ045_003087 [Rhodiola kirilowii]
MAMELLDEVAVATTAVIVPGYVRASGDEEEEDRGSYDSVVTEEEKDMAECLILLASGGGGKKRIKLGYECKTCEKTFPSFQALGGHRAVHRKSNPTMIPSCNDDRVLYSSSNCSISLQLSTPSSITTTTNDKNDAVLPAKFSSKVHQCSICASEFSSGQALGGHMRRHRTVRIPVRSTGDYAPVDHQCSAEVKTRSMLSLDLNLPAPEDGGEDQQNAALLVFSAHAMLGCHYYK